MRLQLGMIAVLAIGISLVGCKSKEQKEAEKQALQGELDKFKGKWKVAGRTADPDEAAEDVTGLVYTFDGDLLKVTLGKEFIEGYKLTIDATKDPKTIDMVYCDEAGKPLTSSRKGIAGRKIRSTLKDVGIYKIDGDKLEMCMSYDEKKRPGEFAAPRGTARFILKLEKLKDGAVVEEPKKDMKDPKDNKDVKDMKDMKEMKEPKDMKDPKAK